MVSDDQYFDAIVGSGDFELASWGESGEEQNEKEYG
jgi:hypothetical protein